MKRGFTLLEVMIAVAILGMIGDEDRRPIMARLPGRHQSSGSPRLRVDSASSFNSIRSRTAWTCIASA